jgi:hypothetical protein
MYEQVCGMGVKISKRESLPQKLPRVIVFGTALGLRAPPQLLRLDTYRDNETEVEVYTVNDVGIHTSQLLQQNFLDQNYPSMCVRKYGIASEGPRQAGVTQGAYLT